MSGGRTDTLQLPKAITRLVVLGDPHGDLIALDLVLAQETRADTVIVSAGDNIGYADGKLSSFLCLTLAEREIRSVYGNHEDWSREGKLFLAPPGLPKELTPEAVAWINALPERIKLVAENLDGIRMTLVHTLPDWAYVNQDSAERLADLEQAHVTFCGHSHRPAIYVLRRGKPPKPYRLNPTSKDPVQVRFDPGARYVVDAGSLARPTRGRQGPLTARGTYAAFDLRAGVLELHAVDKRARMKALLDEMTADPGGGV